MREVVIASYVRSAQSRCRPNDPGRDWLFKLRTDDLLAKLLPEATRRAGMEPADVDDFIVGVAQAVGENFTLGGRSPLGSRPPPPLAPTGAKTLRSRRDGH